MPKRISWLRCAAASALLAVFTSVPALADICHWNGGIGDWTNSVNWSGGEPDFNDSARFELGGTARIGGSDAAECGYLSLGWDIGQSGTVSITGGSLDVNLGEMKLGRGGTGDFYQSGGQVRADWGVLLGSGPQASGTYELSGGSLNTADGGTWVGRVGAGEFRHTGGSHSTALSGISGIYVAYEAGSTGEYHLSGTGTIAVPVLHVGGRGTGEFTQNGGTVTVDQIGGGGSLGVGHSGNAVGTYELNDGSLSTDNVEYIGLGATGEFTQTGGSNTTENLMIGTSTNGDGTYAISGGTLSGGDVIVGDNGSGTLKVIGDDATIDLDTYIQNTSGLLVSEIEGDGISLMDTVGTATLGGTWTIVDTGAVPLGTYNVLTAAGGITGSFDTVNLPNAAEWTWGITPDSKTLYVSHVPEPATLSLLAIGGLVLIRRRRAA